MCHQTLETDVSHTGEEGAYGILMRNRTHYDYFKGAFFNNRMMFKTKLSSAYAQNSHSEQGTSFQLYEVSRQRDVFVSLGVILCFILLYGGVRGVFLRWKEMGGGGMMVEGQHDSRSVEGAEGDEEEEYYEYEYEGDIEEMLMSRVE